MTTNRAYRKSLSKEEAIAILEEEKGKQFNPFIVSLAKETFKDLEMPEHTTQMPKDLLEEMRFSYYFRDQLTGYYNSSYLKFIFAHARDCNFKMLCIDHLDCKNFASYNKAYGWKEGDLFLRHIADEIQKIYPEAIIVRAYSDHFLVLHTQTHEHMDYARIDTLLNEHGLLMRYQHIDLNMDEPLSFEILEDKLMNNV
jgi:GGDEF domain-containing protein